MTDNFLLSDHPLARQKLTRMRREDLGCGDFSRLMRELGMLIAYEVTRDLQADDDAEIETGRGQMRGTVLRGNKPVIVPILRTGLRLAEGIQEVIPQAHAGHIGIHKDKISHQMIEYLVSIPDPADRLFILVDPVIATGDTACRAIEILKENDVEGRNIRFAAVVAARAGAERLAKEHCDVKFHCVAIDAGLDGNTTGLNNTFQVIPGLGSVSERLYGFKTKRAQL